MLLILKFFDPDHKSYGFRRLYLIGVFVRRPEKSSFKSAENSAASSVDVGSYFYKRKTAQKSYGNGSPRVDPLPSWLRPAAAAAEQKSCFDGAENRAASSLWVGG